MRLSASPALSACDSLDGIDLDELLAAQGALSHFPTPPLKKSPFVEIVELLDDSDSNSNRAKSRDYAYIANVFTEQASIDIISTPFDIETIQNILIRADLPLEIVALAYNILTALNLRERGLGNFLEASPDLLAVCALSLAASYTYDHPPTSSWWSHYACRSAWPAKRIDQAIIKCFSHLDFQLHRFSTTDEIEKAIVSFLPSAGPETEVSRPDLAAKSPEKQPLRLYIDGTSTYWEHGQLTPDDTESPIAPPGSETSTSRFLPLL